jgi:subtilisin-like proprotein convertase family protein
MKHTKGLVRRTFYITNTLLLILILGGQGALLAIGDKTGQSERIRTVESKETTEPNGETSLIPGADFGFLNAGQTGLGTVPQVGADLGSESEPNGTTATADALTGSEGKIRGLLWNEGPIATDGNDTDFYVFTTSAPNTRIYASTQTQSSTFNSTDTTLAVLAADGTTVLETDLNDGTLGASAASIAGLSLPTAGTYYLRVTNVSATTPVTPYYLYFAVKDAVPTAEVEPNNNGGTPNPIPASGLVSGAVNPAADTDTFSIALNAGDTIFASLDTDPERDNVQWNGRLAIGLFGTPATFLLVNDASAGSAANPLSEAHFMTVLTSGTYVVYVDEAAGGGGATNTYNLNVTVIPRAALSCTTTTNSTATPLTDAGLTSSTINIPGSPIIRKLRVYLNITHSLTADLDVHLVSPANNDNGLFSDVTTVATQTAPQIDLGLDDDAAIPMGAFQINKGMIYQPEVNYRLSWFDGENAGGNWRLDIRDDTATNTGTLNSWSLEICTDPAPAGNLIYNENFEASNGGYTSSGTLNEWEYGTPATVAAAGVAPFNTCASGTNCWKTDLDGTYEISSSQDLTSPNLNLTQYQGALRLYWQQRYSVENINFDRIWVRVTEVGNPTNTRIVWLHDAATMNETIGATPTVNIGESAGWGRYSADISDFAGKVVQVTFHLDSDSSVNLSGWAIDDVQIYQIGPVAASVGIGGRVLDAKGNAISRAIVTLTGSDGITRSVKTNTFGYYRFDTVEVGDTYILNAERKGYLFSPRVLSVQDEISDADITAIE